MEVFGGGGGGICSSTDVRMSAKETAVSDFCYSTQTSRLLLPSDVSAAAE